MRTNSSNYDAAPSTRKKLLIGGSVVVAHAVLLASCSESSNEQIAQNAPPPVMERVTTVDAEASADIAVQEAGAPAYAVAPTASMRFAPPEPYIPVQQNRERYDGEEVSSIKLVQTEPVSTFSVDVDTGAYANTRRFLTQGQLPPQAAVRTEEMINYFRYDYPRPANRSQPFSVTTDVAKSPWNEDTYLMRIGLRGYDIPRSERPAANLVFLMDVSGSMGSPDKLPLVKTALSGLAGELGDEDRVSIVVYAGAAGVVLEPTNDTRKIRAALRRLDAGGSTAGGAGLELAYNIAADSLRWAPIISTAGTRLFKDKLALNVNANFDIYQTNDLGQRINKMNPGIFRLTSANLTANYSFSSRDFNGEGDDDQDTNSGNGNQDTPDVLGKGIDPTNRFANDPNSPQNSQDTETKAELYNSKIPWTLNIAYSALYSNTGLNAGIQTHSMMFGGNLDLTPKWQVGFSTGYDIVRGGFTFTRLNFRRDLDSWNFNFNWVPFGLNQSYTFFIGVKQVFSDLKYDKNRPPNRVLF